MSLVPRIVAVVIVVPPRTDAGNNVFAQPWAL